MPRKASDLTDVQIRSAKPKEKLYKLTDGKTAGLHLAVHPNGTKTWRLKYRLGGKERLYTIGNYGKNAHTLGDARTAALDAKRLIGEGIDPTQHKHAEKAANITTGTNTFKAIAVEWLGVHEQKVTPKHFTNNKQRLEKWIFPHIGETPITEVKASQILACLRRLESVGSIETAKRVRVLCGQVIRYAITTDRAEIDPTQGLKDALSKAKPKHHAAILDEGELGGLLRAIYGCAGHPATQAALRIAPILFVRPGELRKMRWSDLDLEAAQWNYTASKTGLAVAIPLPHQVTNMLRELYPVTGHREYVFPSTRGGGQPMSEATLKAALDRLGYRGQVTAHGFRATARTLLVERLNYPAEWVEHQLGHSVRDANGRAYNRTQFIDQRRNMLQAWADYLDALREPESNMAPIKRAKA